MPWLGTHTKSSVQAVVLMTILGRLRKCVSRSAPKTEQVKSQKDLSQKSILMDTENQAYLRDPLYECVELYEGPNGKKMLLRRGVHVNEEHERDSKVCAEVSWPSFADDD